MKFKYNFTPLLNNKISFNLDGTLMELGTLQKVVKFSDYLKFIGSSKTLEVKDLIFSTCSLNKDTDVYIFSFTPNILNGLIGFSLFDTYGFPVEVSKEVCEEKGYSLDCEGTRIMIQLSKELSKGTFKNTSAF